MGEDDFSMQRKVDLWRAEFAKKYSSTSITIIDGETCPPHELVKNLQQAVAPSLFSSKKLIIVKDGLPNKADQKELADAIIKTVDELSKDFFLVFWQTKKLDKRLGVTKQILKANFTVNEFNLPHGQELTSWIKTQVKLMGSAIEPEAADRLGEFLGRDLFEEKKAGGRVIERKEVFNLWQGYSEIQKLASFSKNITVADVELLVKPKLPENVFALSDQILNKNKAGALQVFETLMSTLGSDERSSILKIVGLLSEQVRGLIMVSKLSGLSQVDIAEKLGWSSGRVFMVAKHARNSDVAKLAKLLNKLMHIDVSLKSSDLNPKLLLNLFIAEACS